MAKGHKACPKCGKNVGARVLQCECGYDFVAKEVKPIVQKTPKAHLAGGKGKKQCPKCNLIVGARVKVCTCGYVFISDEKVQELKAKRAAKKSSGEVVNPEVKVLEDTSFPEMPKEMTHTSPDERADQILAKGRARAQNLLNLSKTGLWKDHVNWERVRKGLEEGKAPEIPVSETPVVEDEVSVEV